MYGALDVRLSQVNASPRSGSLTAGHQTPNGFFCICRRGCRGLGRGAARRGQEEQGFLCEAARAQGGRAQDGQPGDAPGRTQGRVRRDHDVRGQERGRAARGRLRRSDPRTGATGRGEALRSSRSSVPASRINSPGWNTSCQLQWIWKQLIRRHQKSHQPVRTNTTASLRWSTRFGPLLAFSIMTLERS